MEAKIKCCDFFNRIKHHFEWFSYQDDNDEKVMVMPCMIASDGMSKIRVNYCPSCGTNIRDIELKDEITACRCGHPYSEKDLEHGMCHKCFAPIA